MLVSTKPQRNTSANKIRRAFKSDKFDLDPDPSAFKHKCESYNWHTEQLIETTDDEAKEMLEAILNDYRRRVPDEDSASPRTAGLLRGIIPAMR